MTFQDFHQQRLSTEQAAEHLGLRPQTLDKWRCTGRYTDLPYFKIGRRVFYLISDIEAFIASRRMLHTGMPAPQLAG